MNNMIIRLMNLTDKTIKGEKYYIEAVMCEGISTTEVYTKQSFEEELLDFVMGIKNSELDSIGCKKINSTNDIDTFRFPDFLTDILVEMFNKDEDNKYHISEDTYLSFINNKQELYVTVTIPAEKDTNLLRPISEARSNDGYICKCGNTLTWTKIDRDNVSFEDSLMDLFEPDYICDKCKTQYVL